MTKQELVAAVKRWRSTHHPKTFDENWYIQNLLGDILGWNTPEQEEVSQLFAPEQPTQDFKQGKSVFEISKAMKEASKEDLFKPQEIEPPTHFENGKHGLLNTQAVAEWAVEITAAVNALQKGGK